ncbi:hypothetical protein UFOVP464_19 [uncultured Caudovirales phage]|uniref:Uncharacterized protein n=1 Tax=uncultured Caudovirales phage TaxID=2100421 RepID=A0A6J5R3I6_9CAUD|nr:hypothetical protein UFOVP464_19 [uncultured Caudovirales phage]CAB4189276.1 hypothetical protein UFOVP1189_34 [uncultured Caudovirales phage]
MSTLGSTIFEGLSDAAPLIHEDTKGVLPAGRIGITGQAGEPAADTVVASVLAYHPDTDDAAQWHTLGELVDGGYYGAFQDSTNQAIGAVGTAYAITFDTTDNSNGVTIGSPTSRIVFGNAGTYNIQWSAQVTNTASQDHDATFWIRVNGTDVTGSAGIIMVPSKHGSVNGHVLPSWNYVLELEAADYIEMMWHAASTTISLETAPVGVSPVHPSAASIILTATQVAGVVAGGGGGGGGDPVVGGDLSGVASNATVVAIQGDHVSATAPTVDEVLIYDGDVYTPGKLRATQLASYLTPIFTEDGAVVFDETGVVLAEVDF